MTKADIAQEFINQHPGVPSRTLARELRKAEPAVFHTDDSAYKAICYVRGTLGKSHPRGRAKEPEIPETSEHIWLPFNLEPSSKDRISLLSDIHIPFHNKQALELAVSESERIGSTVILLNGDTIDCHELSRFERDPRERCFREEIPLIKQFLAFLRHKFPKARIVWKDGNHDERLYLYLRRHAPAIVGVDNFEAPSVFGFADYGVEYVTDKRPIVCGKLNILHGHEYPGGFAAPVNPSRGLFLRAKACCIEGHYHQTSEHAEPTLEGKSIACWSTGCLCYSEDTEVLTESGFVAFPALNSLDRIAEYDPDTKTITYRTPRAMQKLQFTGDMYSFKSNRVDLLVTPNHKMIYVKDGEWAQDSAENASKLHLLSVPVGGLFNGDKDCVDADTARLICWIITEGSFDESDGGCRVMIYQKTPKHVAAIRALLMRMGIKSSHSIDKNGCHRFRLSTELSRKLRELLPHKLMIPRCILNGRLSVLRAAYETLIAGDGHRKDNGKTDCFSTISKALATDFQELCCKIGFSSRIVFKRIQPSKLCPDGGWIYLCPVRKFQVCNVKTRERVPYNGMVYDVTTSTGFFVVRRNGLVSISGNCELHPPYMPLNKWNHGFATIEMAREGNFKIRNHKIINGEIY